MVSNDVSTLCRLLQLGRKSVAASLVVEAWTDAPGPEMWAAQALQLLAALPGVELRRVVVLPPAEDGSSNPWGQAFFERRQRLLAPAPWPATTAGRPDGEPPPDVLVYLGRRHLQGKCSHLAGKSVLSIRFGCSPHRRFLWPEIAGDGETVPVEVLQHGDDWCDPPKVLLRAEAPKIQRLFYLTGAAAALESAPHLLARALQGVRHAPAGGGVPAAPPLGLYLARCAASSLRANTLLRGKKRQWFVAWRRRAAAVFGADAGAAATGFAIFQGRPGMGYADPFPFRADGRDFLFLEEIPPDEKGRLVVVEMRGGSPAPGEPRVILEESYHLSYQHVFEHEGRRYLIPESAENASVDLYEAEEFPYRWRKRRTLAEGVRLLDTTPFFHEGVWYFFTATQPRPGTGFEGLLFTSDSLEGRWRWHPANPVSLDARRVRAAGRLCWHGERLLRAVQDCSLDYGRAVRLLEVTKLTPGEYEDREIAVVTPDWHDGAVRTHTLNWNDAFEVIDGSRWVPAEPSSAGGRR